MLPSEELRNKISEIIDIDLNRYAWNEEFKNFVFNFKLDKLYEDELNYLEEAFLYGLNIGHCGLTSRYIALNIPKVDLYYGTFLPLAGTKNSKNGNHAWTVCGEYLIDTTLMTVLKVDEAKELGYIFERKIAPESARELSEYDTFSMEFRQYNKDKKAFTKSLTLINKANG